MKALILAGGKGTRFAEETSLRPKPMIEIGGMPMLWHIMKIYGAHGVNEFVIALGYKGEVIKEWVRNLAFFNSDIQVDLQTGDIQIFQKQKEPWKITLVETGEDSYTATRIKKCLSYIHEDFCLTYGDGVSDVNIKETIEFHQKMKKQVTVTVAQPPARFGAIEIENGIAKRFTEKPQGEGGWINAGFFVLKRDGLENFLPEQDCMWEEEPMRQLVKENQLAAYKHNGFWMPMDTLRDKMKLEALWEQGAPWKIWRDYE